MRHHLLLTAVVAALVLLGSLLLIPRRDEHLTMLTRDGRFEEASLIIDAMRAQGDARPELLHQQVILHIKQGDVPRALTASRSHLEARPDDVSALETHAELLLHAGLMKEHLAASGRLVRLRPNRDRLWRLLAHLRLAGEVEDELALLDHFVGSRMLKLEHFERLGSLLSARGDWRSAERWLRHADRLAPADESQARLRLLHVLLQSGQEAEALQFARRWLETWRDPYLSGRLLLALSREASESAAMPLALHFVDTMPEAALEVASVLTQAGQAGVSRAILSRWIDRTPSPSSSQARDFVHASFVAGEVGKPLRKLLDLMRAAAPSEVVAGFVEEIAHAYGSNSIAHLMPHLSADILHKRPLLGADLALSSGNAQLARWYLDKAEVAVLAEEQQDRWLELLRRTATPSGALEQMLLMWSRQHLPPRLIASIAEQARIAGRPAVHDAIWNSLRR